MKATKATATKAPEHRCHCIVFHVTDPEHRVAITNQIAIERMGRQTKATRAAITILEEQLRTCPRAGGAL